MIRRDLASIGLSDGRIPQALSVIAEREDDLICHQLFIHQVKRQQIGHLPRDQPDLFIGIGAGQHLAGPDALFTRLIALDISHRAGLAAPGVVDEQFGVDAKQLVQQVFIVIFIRPAQRTASDITHCEEAVRFQL
ncbi:hypothetical protein SDC9_173932 [bioreactor metagenome]|uniref:Uncharacterized protein n=1 Tax=bioreactor metagenome TaxID=1076179 RepID=A0A645GHT4_9ZZZZ